MQKQRSNWMDTEIYNGGNYLGSFHFSFLFFYIFFVRITFTVPSSSSIGKMFLRNTRQQFHLYFALITTLKKKTELKNKCFLYYFC